MAEVEALGQQVLRDNLAHAAAFGAHKEAMVGGFYHMHRGIRAETGLPVGFPLVQTQRHGGNILVGNAPHEQPFGGGCQQCLVGGDVDVAHAVLCSVRIKAKARLAAHYAGMVRQRLFHTAQSAAHRGNPQPMVAVFLDVVDVVVGEKILKMPHGEGSILWRQGEESVGLAAQPQRSVGGLRHAIDGRTE